MTMRTDWAGLLRAGLGRLGLRPAEFWALTPAELMLLLAAESGARTGGTPMGRAGFEALAGAWPDGEERDA